MLFFALKQKYHSFILFRHLLKRFRGVFATKATLSNNSGNKKLLWYKRGFTNDVNQPRILVGDFSESEKLQKELINLLNIRILLYETKNR